VKDCAELFEKCLTMLTIDSETKNTVQAADENPSRSIVGLFVQTNNQKPTTVNITMEQELFGTASHPIKI
jgi:hypothetical protein